MTGGRVAHPLLISLANIKMATRNKASSNAFLLAALLPIAEFLHPVKWMQSVLEARLVHQCLDIVLELLKQAARIGWMMSDSLGNLRYCFTPLALYISHICFSLLNPYITGTWCLAAVGSQELDFCFSILQPLMTFRRFKDGVSKIKQVTGRAQCDMQCYIVALIADAASHGVVIAVHVLMDFRYLSQATTINETHCQKILGALKEFHEYKPDIIAAECIEVPRANSICQVGSPLQWSADTTEHAHITLIKNPTDSSNNNNYDAQICQFLDRQDKCQNFQIATSIITQSQTPSQASAYRLIDVDSEYYDSNEDPDIDEAHLQAVQDDLCGPKRMVTNFFRKAEQASLNIKVARPPHTFVVAPKKSPQPNCREPPPNKIKKKGPTSQKFHSLGGQHQAPPNAPLPFNDLMVWFKVCVQQVSYHNPSIIPPALTVNASPPSTTWKYGHYNAAIFAVDDTINEEWPASGLKGHAVVEVHLIMQPLPSGLRGQITSSTSSASWAAHFLTYVQQLDVMPQRHGNLLECL
ncbi:hypothetical protein P692DRAFT_201807031 [Suillus brevipes Sb2]|nr:hypothetical protein P692DRAFT_201807031 [Suillus brevipes Sb2]